MPAIKKPGTYFVLALLILCTGFISCTSSQQTQSMDITEAKATMSGILERMEALRTEVAQMRDVMTENPKAVMGDKGVITLTPKMMTQMIENMYRLVDNIGKMMKEIDSMVSNEELMMNAALKEHALNLVEEISHCVDYMDGVWSGQ